MALNQLELIRLSDLSPAFVGEMQVLETEPHLLHLRWHHPTATARLEADLRSHGVRVYEGAGRSERVRMRIGALATEMRLPLRPTIYPASA